MMRNGDQYAVAVRKTDGEIAVEKKEYKSIINCPALKKIPFVRGVFNFIDSLALGMSTLTFSASFFEEEEGEELSVEEAAKKKKKDDLAMAFTMVLAVVLAIAIFMILPYFLIDLLRGIIKSDAVIALLEGVFRLAIFLIYILLISQMKDIQRVFMYHGAEHKCINCIEHGLELNVENVRKSSRQHKRCGTSFLLFVMLVSCVLLFFVRADSQIMRVVIRIALLPVIAGISYELIKWAGNSDNPIVCILSKPGLWLQGLTTKEPDDSMIEVAIRAVEEVFDWKTYLKENFGA